MREKFIEEISHLNKERENLVEAICEEAKSFDGTFTGASSFLESFREDCIKYDDEAREHEGVIGAYEIHRDASVKLLRLFKEDTERRKSEKIW